MYVPIVCFISIYVLDNDLHYIRLPGRVSQKGTLCTSDLCTCTSRALCSLIKMCQDRIARCCLCHDKKKIESLIMICASGFAALNRESLSDIFVKMIYFEWTPHCICETSDLSSKLTFHQIHSDRNKCFVHGPHYAKAKPNVTYTL